MAKKLTSRTGAGNNAPVLAKLNVKQSGSALLTEYQKNKVIMCFGLKLENNYTFKKFKPENLKEFQKILDDSTELDIDEFENRYIRPTDKTDIFYFNDNDFQIIHFGKNGSKFRIHGFYANGLFHVIRLDPNHQFHGT